MKLPERVKIGGHWYCIEFPYHFKERGDINGQHDSDMEVIRIDDRDSYDHGLRPDASIICTFIHEMLHAVDSVTGHQIFKDNEGAIEGFSQCIYQILLDNGWLNDIQASRG